MVQLKKGDDKIEHCDLRPTEMQRSKKNVESVVQAFQKLLNPFSTPLMWRTLDIQEDLLKAEIWQRNTK